MIRTTKIYCCAMIRSLKISSLGVPLTSRDVGLVFGIVGSHEKIQFTKDSGNVLWIERNFGDGLKSLNKSCILDRISEFLTKKDEMSVEDVARLMVWRLC